MGEQYAPKIMSILRTESILGSNFTGFYKKKTVLKSSFLQALGANPHKKTKQENSSVKRFSKPWKKQDITEENRE